MDKQTNEVIDILSQIIGKDLQKERKIFEDSQKKQGNFNEVMILKKENEFLKFEMQRTKKEIERYKSLIEFEKFKNEKLFYELLK